MHTDDISETAAELMALEDAEAAAEADELKAIWKASQERVLVAKDELREFLRANPYEPGFMVTRRSVVTLGAST